MIAQIPLVAITSLLCAAYGLFAISLNRQWIDDHYWIMMLAGAILAMLQIHYTFEDFEVWLGRLFPVRPRHIMAPLGQQNTRRGNNRASSTSESRPTQKLYADFLNHGLSSRTPLPSRLAATKSTPATDAVFNTPELLAMILSNLPLRSHRSYMRVCKRFWECTRPDAQHRLSGIGEALGVKFSRTIESVDEAESAELLAHTLDSSYQYYAPSFSWLLNVNFSFLFLERDHPEPMLTIKPFTIEAVAMTSKTQIVEVSLNLKADDIQNLLGLKGVTSFEDCQSRLFSNRTVGGVRHNWMDIKLLNMPFKVRVAVKVDMREAMGSADHGEGICPAHGCQVGLFGIQRTFRDFTPEEATLGEFVAFLDRVEYDARAKARVMKYTRDSNGRSWYMGPQSTIPPAVKPEYGRQYIPESCVRETWMSEMGTVMDEPRTGSLSDRLTGGRAFGGIRSGSILQSRRCWPFRRRSTSEYAQLSEDE